ncbi:MAG: hypothetical protein KAW19_12055 [Candidatus Aminicenantes bacterium]|jgi:hypothetical protein|nr:hypothetical protein [Candidatus Aminicenantes bacterium]
MKGNRKVRREHPLIEQISKEISIIDKINRQWKEGLISEFQFSETLDRLLVNLKRYQTELKQPDPRSLEKKIVPEFPDMEVPELKLPEIKLPKIEDIELQEIEDLEIPGLPGRGGLVLGLLRDLMPGLKITLKKRYSWIQAFKRMGPAEISRIISLSQSEIYCRRAIEEAVKAMEK